MSSLVKTFTDGIIRENPLTVLALGFCSALAVTNNAACGIAMGLSITFVLLMSAALTSIAGKLIPEPVRFPAFIIVVACFTTAADLFLKAFFPDISLAMGVYVPLIAVNCLIIGRVEAFASKQPLPMVIADALGMGLGATWVLLAVSVIRELFGNGTVMGLRIMPEAYTPILFFAMSPGGFFVFACVMAFGLFIGSNTKSNPKNKTEEKA